MDKRWKQLGELLVHYSTEVKPGEKVLIAFGEVESYPLVEAVYQACITAGAHPQVQFLSEKLNRLTLVHGSLDQVRWAPELEALGMAWADVYLGLRGGHNPDIFWDVPAEKLALFREALGKISTARWQQTRWCLLRVPNASLAQQAGIDETTMMDMFFEACFLDWRAEAAKWRGWAARLNEGRHFRVVGKGTDLSFSTQGRRWEVGDGRQNMPDGEIMTAPVEGSVHGQITFEFPGVLAGRRVEGIRLAWEKGVLVSATANTNQDFLQSILHTDTGASLVGEFGIGTNPKIEHFCKDILLDEKMRGTVHIALGRAYPKCGGTNQSAIHWDIIKDMRQEGEIIMDGKLVYQLGRVLI
jgi:aminopeptidase